jgi:hypothetical protein
MQTTLYFFNYGSDRWPVKSLVVYLMTLSTVHQVLLLKSVFPVLITHWARVAGLSELQPELLHRIYIAPLIAIPTQLFFLYRIYICSRKNWIFPALMLPFVAWQLIGTIPYNAAVMSTTDLSVISLPRQVAISTSFRAVMAGVDIMIAIAMTYLLRRNCPPNINEDLKKMAYRLIMVTINTGIWTAILALMVLITQLVFPATLIFCIFEFPLTSLYINSLLANLNSRRYIRGDLDTSDWATRNPHTSILEYGQQTDTFSQHVLTTAGQTSNGAKDEEDHATSKTHGL